MKREYHEGPETAERFEKLSTVMFRAPKSIAKPEVKPRPNAKTSND
jgi:hypothetical protein